MMKKTKRITAAIALASVLFLTGQAARADELRAQYKIADGLYFGDGESLVHIQGRLQARYTYTFIENGVDTGTFSIPRGEIRIDGFTMAKKLRYAFEMNLATRNAQSTATVCAPTGTATAACPSGTATVVTGPSTSGLATLNDYYVDWVPKTYVGVEGGQFKVPYLFTELVSSTRLEYVDRGLFNSIFSLGRDIGANVHGTFFDEKLKYYTFMMNGNGPNSFDRNAKSPMAGTRIEYVPLGIYEYTETDFAYSEDQNLGFGAAYVFNEPGSAVEAGTIPAFNRMSQATFDFAYKHKGISVQGAGAYAHTMTGSTVKNYGYNIQLGYFFVPKFFEVGVKAGGGVLSTAVDQYEYAGVLNFFPWSKGHGIKFQTDFTYLQNDGGVQGQDDYRARVAMNLIF
jgi:hypothetical protein